MHHHFVIAIQLLSFRPYFDLIWNVYDLTIYYTGFKQVILGMFALNNGAKILSNGLI